MARIEERFHFRICLGPWVVKNDGRRRFGGRLVRALFEKFSITGTEVTFKIITRCNTTFISIRLWFRYGFHWIHHGTQKYKFRIPNLSFTSYVVTKHFTAPETDALFFIIVALALKSTELLNFRRKPRGEHGVNVKVLHSDRLARQMHTLAYPSSKM